LIQIYANTDSLHFDPNHQLVAAGVIEEQEGAAFERDFVTDGAQAHIHDDDDLFSTRAGEQHLLGIH
jgi:hypothetical protein